eukprot:TRINITY_DN255_c0_g2_i5.p1 TRINITY_DN255_c0_g2~~TRINITY_DN255_c0_g2_i5.p1  ORF type:complete len:436 (+),score=142.05 TRINITY_DN255_c0_g2_i5:924-2231(+)
MLFLEFILKPSWNVSFLAKNLASWPWHSGVGGNNDWASPPLVQNTLFDLTHSEGQNKVTISPYHLERKDLVSLNPSELAANICDLFTVPGYQNQFSKDLFVAESLCKYGAPHLASYPYLNPSLPEYLYGLDDNGFGNLQDRLPRGTFFIPMTLNMTCSIKSLIQREPRVSELIFSFCIAVLIQQSDVNSKLGDEVFEIDLGIPLTEDQQHGRQILSDVSGIIKGFKVVHLPAMMGLCWNGKVHQTANVPLSPLDQEATKTTFNKLTSNLQYHPQIPALLASFRVAGLRVFMNGISDNFGGSPIYFTLATISVPFIDDESGIDWAPFNLPAKHFGQVLKLAEEILGPNEVTTLTDDDAPLFSLGAIRHFLHVDAQHKPKPQALSPCGSLSVGTSFSSASASASSAAASSASPATHQFPSTSNIIITSTSKCPDLNI